MTRENGARANVWVQDGVIYPEVNESRVRAILGGKMDCNHEEGYCRGSEDLECNEPIEGEQKMDEKKTLEQIVEDEPDESIESLKLALDDTLKLLEGV